MSGVRDLQAKRVRHWTSAQGLSRRVDLGVSTRREQCQSVPRQVAEERGAAQEILDRWHGLVTRPAKPLLPSLAPWTRCPMPY